MPGGGCCDLQQQGESATLEQILAQQQRRDAEDAARDVGPLRRADDALEFLTDGLTQEQVVDRLEALVPSAIEPAAKDQKDFNDINDDGIVSFP